MKTNIKIDKSKFKDPMGRPLTQSLFLEPVYNTDYAFYTLDDDDKTYKGKIYYSLKKLYLDMEDPIEYEFATTYLLGWNHWKKICNNAILDRHISEWRDELELKLMSAGVSSMLEQSDQNMQAAKWLAERGWSKRGAGRPKKEEMERDRQLHDRLDEEFGADVLRMEDFK